MKSLASRGSLLLLLTLPTVCLCQDSTGHPDSAPKQGEAVATVIDCGTFAASDPRLDLVSRLCAFALTYRNKLPDFIAQQTTTFESGSSTTVMTAEVTFQKGQETYSRVKVDGQPAQASALTTRPPDGVQFSSTGEFGPALLDLFRVPGATEFKFKSDSTLRNQPIAIYEFHIPQKKNVFWTVRPGDGRVMRPEFNGELWVEQQTGKPLREEIAPAKLLIGAEIVSTKTVIDFATTPVGDAGNFLLPSRSESTMCKQGVNEPPNCTKSVLVFHEYRKFGAATRILPSASQQ